VLVDPIAGSSSDLVDDGLEPCVVDLARSAAARADDVVMVASLAGDVGVLARWQVQALDESQALEGLQCPEHRGPPHAQPPPTSGRDEVGGGEVAVLFGDQLSQRPSRSGAAEAGSVERNEDRGRVAHGPG
jgi:hypothetical protein